MSLYIGNSPLVDCSISGVPVREIWVGSDRVWQKHQPYTGFVTDWILDGSDWMSISLYGSLALATGDYLSISFTPDSSNIGKCVMGRPEDSGSQFRYVNVYHSASGQVQTVLGAASQIHTYTVTENQEFMARLSNEFGTSYTGSYYLGTLDTTSTYNWVGRISQTGVVNGGNVSVYYVPYIQNDVPGLYDIVSGTFLPLTDFPNFTPTMGDPCIMISTDAQVNTAKVKTGEVASKFHTCLCTATDLSSAFSGSSVKEVNFHGCDFTGTNIFSGCSSLKKVIATGCSNNTIQVLSDSLTGWYYDSVNQIFYVEEPYTLLAGARFSGSQYMDTGITLKSGDVIHAEGTAVSGIGGMTALCGCAKSDLSGTWYILCATTNGVWAMSPGSGESYKSIVYNEAQDLDFTISSNAPSTLYIGSANVGGSPYAAYNYTHTLNSLRITRSGNVILDVVAVRRPSDSKVFLWDKISDTYSDCGGGLIAVQ